jgi:hypothetical protein
MDGVYIERPHVSFMAEFGAVVIGSVGRDPLATLRHTMRDMA